MHHEELAGTLGTVAHEDAGRVGDLPAAAQAEPAFPDHGLASEEDGPASARDHNALQLAADEIVPFYEPVRQPHQDPGLFCWCGSGHHDAALLSSNTTSSALRIFSTNTW